MYRTSEKTSLSRKMAALEDRWRKSQEDRYILELKFKEVLKGLADKHEGNKLMKIKEKYNRFIENEDSRNERNDRILRTLDKIESQANMLSAKTERLKLLKLHYEAYMKRMYPTWKEEINGVGNIENKESLHSINQRYEQKHVSYSTSREDIDDKKANYKSPYHPPRNSERSVWNPNSMHDASHTRQNGNFQLANIKPRYTNNESNVKHSFNHELSAVNTNSEEKTSSSPGRSAGQEENTSKDLLNVSLSDDNVFNNSTAPIEEEKAKGDIKANLYSNFKPTGKENGHVQDWIYHSSPKADYGYERNNEYLSQPYKRHSNNNQGTASTSGHIKGDDFNECSQNIRRKEHDSNAGYFPPEEARTETGENRGIEDDALEFNPSVVVTRATPDIGKSCSEDDVSDQRGPGEDKKSNRHRKISSRETSGITSEAEVSEAEVVASESGDEFKKQIEHSADVPQYLRSPSALGNNQGNLESYQFSSSDADYDELENQMAALVEGKRNDESDANDICHSMNKRSINHINVSRDVPASGVNQIGGTSLDMDDAIQEDKKVSEDITSGVDDEEGSHNDEKIDSVGSNSETGGQMGYFNEHQQNLRSAPDELGNNSPDRENVREIDRQSASYESDECEKNVEMDRSSDHKFDEDGVRNAVMNSERIDESYNQQGVRMESDDSFIEEGKKPEEIHLGYEEQEENVERQYLDKDLSEREYISQRDPNTELEGEFETEQGNDTAYFESELHDRDINYPEEQTDYRHSTDEQPIDEEVIEEHRYSDGETEVTHGQEAKREDDDELQGELQEEEGNFETNFGTVNDEYQKTDEGVKSDVDDQNLMKRESQEAESHSKETTDEEESYFVEDTRNKPVELAPERYETIEEKKDDEYYHENVLEEEVDTFDRGNMGEGSELERPEVIERQEGYERTETKCVESAEMIENEAEVINYVGDAEAKTVENLAVYTPEGSYDAQETQESVQHESYQNEEESIEEVQNRGIHNEEKVQHKEQIEVKQSSPDIEKQSSSDIEKQRSPDIEEGSHYERSYEERKDDLTPEPELPIKELDLEKSVDSKEDQVSQVRSHETKKAEGKTRSETPIEQTDVAITGEGKKTNQTASNKEHSKVKKAVDEAKPAKETSHVPSRPLSRQSTRKDGAGQDAYKAEKLKTAVRKFQAKKDSRQTTRKPLDSRK